MDTSNSKYRLFLCFEPALHPLFPYSLGEAGSGPVTPHWPRNVGIQRQKTNGTTGERRSASVLDAVHQSQGGPPIGRPAIDTFVKLFGDAPLAA